MTARLSLVDHLLLVAIAGAIAAPAALNAQAPERLYYYVDNEDSYNSLVKHIDRIDVLGPQIYTVDSLGTVWGSLDPRVKKLAAEHKVKVMPLVVNEGFNQPALRKLLADTAARSRATRSIATLCKDEGYWGFQFDIENVNMQDRDLFTAWYTETANALHAVGCTISIAVVHRPAEFAGPTGYDRFLHENWRAGYDLAAIGKAGDFISLMTYAQQTRRTPPGPIAGLPWMRAVVDYSLEYVPADKLSLGIPTWSEHWFTRDDPSLPERARSWSSNASWQWAKGLADRHDAEIRWDEKQGVPFTYYENGGVYEWIFFENARSFRAKLDLMKEKKLRGYSAWVLGPEDPAIWEVK